MVGATVIVVNECSNRRCSATDSKWHSSPQMRTGSQLFEINVLLCAAILYSGNMYKKMSLFASILGLAIVSRTTFSAHCKDYLYPDGASAITVENGRE